MSWIPIAFALICIAGFAAAWRSWARPPQPTRDRAQGYMTGYSKRLANQAIQRIFSQSDQQLAASAGRKAARKLRRNRRYAMHLYLHQLRGEFRTVSRQARDAAAHSDTSADGLLILRLTWEFYALQFLLYLQTYLGWRPLDSGILISRIEPLRHRL